MKNSHWKKTIPYYILAVIGCLGLIFYTVVSCANSTKDLEGFSWRIPVIFGSIFILAGSLMVVWMVFREGMKDHHIYFGMSFIILSVMIWSQTPLHHHDNQFHYDSTYVLSNILLGEDTGVGIMGGRIETYQRRECDKFMQYAAFDKFITAYADMQREMFVTPKAESVGLVETKTYQNFVSEPLYFYLPQALGFVVARICQLNVYWLLFLGRLFLAVASCILTGFAIKNTPVFKEIFLLCGLLPTTILSYVSVSRDALILAFSFYYIAKCFRLAYSKENIKGREYLSLFLSLLLLAPYKFVYIPFVILVALIIYRKKGKQKLDKKIKIAGILSVILSIVFFLLINYHYILPYILGSNKLTLKEGSPFTILYILQNPLHTLAVVGKTLLTSTVRYLANLIAIGDYGGGIHKEMVVVAAAFIVVLLLQSYREKEEEFSISFWERMIMVITWLAISGMIVLAYLMLTPTTNDVIIGIQGRYFTPVFPLMLVSFCSFQTLKKIRNKTWRNLVTYLDTKLAGQLVYCGIYGLALFVAVNMFVWVVTYL